MIRFVSLVILGSSLLAGPASAVVYCKSVGVPKGCVARPAAVATPGVGAPGVGVRPGVGVGARAWVSPRGLASVRRAWAWLRALALAHLGWALRPAWGRLVRVLPPRTEAAP